MIAITEMLPPDIAIPANVRASTVPRFTIDGDDQLEHHLQRTCERVVSGIRGLIPAEKLEAVLLGGGYGRGEGGVLRHPTGDQPYNDLEFYIAISGNRHWNEAIYQRRLHVLGEILTHLAGVEVEFKITSGAELAQQPISMFSYDLVVGHRLLWSTAKTETLAGCAHHRRPENIPLEEATRLMMNRCSGLLFARGRLADEPFSPVAADFVRRNIAKAQLAIGDTILAAHGLYHWSCRERHQWLERLAQREPSPWLTALVRHHAAGVEFKLHPATTPLSRETLTALHAEVSAFALGCWLWLESRRLGRTFDSPRTYALDSADYSPRASGLRSVMMNFRADHFRLHLGAKPWRHPRQRIFRALTLLLWEPSALSDPVLRGQLERNLNTPLSNMAHASAAYERLWARLR